MGVNIKQSMDTYEWQKNHAIVLRMYYTERILETTGFFGLAYSATNALYVKKGYMSQSMRGVMAKRVLAPWPYIAGINAFFGFIMLRPLYMDEIKQQVGKRFRMGKWLHSTFDLSEEDAKH